MSVYSKLREEFEGVINSLKKQQESYCFYCGTPEKVIDNDGIHCANDKCPGYKAKSRYCTACGDEVINSNGACEFCNDARKYGTSKDFEIYIEQRIGVYLEELANQKLEYLRFYRAIRD